MLAGILLLSGCASQPMTAEQRQFAMQYMLAQGNRPVPQPYLQPMPAVPAAQPVQLVQPAPRICQSTINGQIINTTCY
jgi:PBP1b-binding outer membrane lipoprotein LpoB